MALEPDSHDWSEVDRWWDTYVGAESLSLTPQTTAAVDPRVMTDVSTDIDVWWESAVDLPGVFPGSAASLGARSMADEWAGVDSWWDAYVGARTADVAELERTFAESNATWARRDGPFDADPLSTEAARTMQSGQPVAPSCEEEWSDWLAFLLRTDHGAFHRELVGDPFTTAPRRVEREAHHPVSGGTDRYADILSIHDAARLSIEVKIGDRRVGKTVDTVEQIERQRYGEWDHFLLLPADDLRVVRDRFGDDRLDTTGDRYTITPTTAGDIELLHWSDVSRALRSVLLGDDSQAPHWAASAYLFSTQIEAEHLGFTPEPVVERVGAEGNGARSFESVSAVVNNLEAQVEYMKEFTESTHE